MSIKLMTAAWSLDGLSIGEKLVFLCLADNASDDGKCWPSVQGMVVRCGMSDRGIQKVISDLEKMKLLTREMRSGRSTIYYLTPELYSPRTQFTPTPELRRTYPRTVFTQNLKRTINRRTVNTPHTPQTKIHFAGLGSR